jgi:hypothetical protein
MTAFILKLIRANPFASAGLAVGLAVVFLWGVTAWKLQTALADAADAKAATLSCRADVNAAAAVAFQYKAESAAKAVDAVAGTIRDTLDIRNNAYKVRKAVSHAPESDDGLVAPVLLRVLDGLRGQ